MDAVETFKLILQEFNAASGQNLALDDENGLSFNFAGAEVNLTVLPESANVLLWVPLARLGDDGNAPARVQWMLEQNDGLIGSNGFTFSVDAETGTIFLSDRRSVLAFEDGESFAAWMRLLDDILERAWMALELQLPYVDEDEEIDDEPLVTEVK